MLSVDFRQAVQAVTVMDTTCWPAVMQKQPLSGLGGKRPLEWVAERTEGYSGADLHELSAEAARHSVLSVTQSLRCLLLRLIIQPL